MPSEVFHCCDTNGNGQLDLHEVKFALNAFGLFPSLDYLSAWMDGPTLSFDAFGKLLDAKLRSAPTSMRGPRTVPYSRRGIRMEQVEGLYETFISSGWLQQQCDNFNAQNEQAICRRKCFAMETNLYALNRWVIMPSTTPQPAEKEGLAVDYFVSHFWGHPFQAPRVHCVVMGPPFGWSQGLRKLEHEVSSLARSAEEASHERHGSLDGVVVLPVYWICLMALNQHRPGDEVGSSPEEGPFNAALVQSSCGAVMILDEKVQPFTRIWCLFEVKRLTDLNKDFHLISAKGAMGANLAAEMDLEQRRVLMELTQRVASGLEDISAAKAKSSSEDDRYAIWHRVADPQLRKVPLAIAREKKLFHPNAFKRFDLTIRSLLAAPLYQTSLQEEDVQSALRYLGLGAPFGRRDLELLRERDIDVVKVEIAVRSGTSLVHWQLLHVAAYFGHTEAVEALVESKANLEAKTKFKLTPLHQAARNGQTLICEMLLDYKADLHNVAAQGRTCLQNAAHQGHRGVVELLLARRANPNIKDENGAVGRRELEGFCKRHGQEEEGLHEPRCLT
ncbi:Ankyrin-2 (ANK-2) (Ankyrin-B) (Brain ankyrin) [Durusdinium trenchii]|uniref:Ankyrin-2 (ANK-2) (Ankyrin-B) (Brain ankyrin) n=1 Tax=Durusdinium trenchii TaxID=1381693 RepID=A0ABP0S7C2_9DINO